MAKIVFYAVSLEVEADKLGTIMGLLVNEGRNLISRPIAEPEPARPAITRTRVSKGGTTSEMTVLKILQDANREMTVDQVGAELNSRLKLSPNSAGPLLSSLARQGKAVRIAPSTYSLPKGKLL